MRISTLKRFVPVALASLAAVVPLGAGTVGAQLAPGALSTVPVPKPDLTGFVRDEAAAVALGKALFWDMQLGSDGVQSCGACHFHGGADNRLKNQVNPGTLHAATTFEVAKPNATLTAANFPLHKLANVEDRRSAVLFDADDVVSSQSVTLRKFNDVIPGQAEENCTVTPDPIFSVGGVNVRRVQPRNVPTMINAIFTFRNFWDGRGNAIFNGVDGTGPRNPNARVLQVQADGSVVPVAVAIAPASLASQAVPVLGSNFALACTGRTVNKVGKKMLSLTPLAKQWVDPTDSVLGPLARSRTTPGARGLTSSYVTLIQTAFDPKWWNSDKVVTFPGGVRTISAPTGAPLTTSQFTVMEQNFSLFFGLAIQLYETTLVSDASLFDQAQLGLATLTPAQQDGLNTFKGSCAGTQCHSGPTFTAASTNNFGAGSEPIEQRQTAAGANAFHDGGFFNIGVRPTAEDLGVGGANPAGVPLSFARRDFLGLGIPEIAAIQNPLPPIGPADVLAVDGAFKAPSLRNVELSAPYMHNGGMLTLDQVVEFYTRGGDFHEANAANADAAVDGVGRLVGKPDRRANVVAFLKTLTDDRVRFESAPFDHPQLFIPNGHPGDAVAVINDGTGKATDALVEVPASGAAGSCVGVDGTPHFACPVCGDNKVNQASEQCDGTDSVLCPGACRANCTCPPAPRCGDNLVNQASEQCDGTADAACPGRCRADCTCAPAPVCGDNAINQPSEQCDGTDSALCPGACRVDCTCPAAPPPPPAPGTVVATVEADAMVNAATPVKNFGATAKLEVDASPVKHALFRVRVSGVGARQVTSATLRLQVSNLLNSQSVAGGRLHAITGCAWDEHTLTAKTQPAIDGPVLATAGAVALGQVVDFDVTGAIQGDGVYCFALESPSADGVRYNSREAAAGKPQLLVGVGSQTTTTPPPPTTTPPPAASAAGTVVADTYVQSDLATTNFGAKPVMSVDNGAASNPGTTGVQHTFLRVSVSGVGARLLTGAHLKLQVANVTNAGSVAGGSIHAITSCTWDEKTVTWATQPAIDGPALATLGAVAAGQVVDFDVTSAIHGDGVYCFAIDTTSTDSAIYNSREGTGQHPALVVQVTP